MAAPPSLNVKLLADLRDIFGDEDAMTTEQLLAGLTKLEESPWSEMRGGKPLDPRGLAQRLRQYGVKSTTVRIGDLVAKGYLRTELWDAWTRYLPNKEEILGGAAKESVTSVTTGTSVTADTPLCDVCQTPLDPVLAAYGMTTHPACDPIPFDDDNLLP